MRVGFLQNFETKNVKITIDTQHFFDELNTDNYWKCKLLQTTASIKCHQYLMLQR